MNTPSRLALATLLALAASPAAAQMNALGSNSPLSNTGQDDSRWKEQKKPSALPGSRFTSATPAAPERSAADMAPNEALFDAVNRGDIAAARDALGRGADVDTRNMLGLTALETAIDLGRNDLTFLLLSMRNAEKPRAGQRQGTTATRTAPPPAPRPAPQQRVAVTRNEPTVQRSFPNTPGTPAPSAGFLGFDERHIAR